MSFKDLVIYGAGISGACMLLYGAWIDLNDWLKDRREDMKMGRALRLARVAHDEEHDYSIAPDESVPLSEKELEDIEDWALMVEMSADTGWIETGIDCAWIYAVDAEAREGWDQEAA